METHLGNTITAELGNLDFIVVNCIDKIPTRFSAMPNLVQIKIGYKMAGRTLDDIRERLAQNSEIGEPESNGNGFLTYARYNNKTAIGGIKYPPLVEQVQIIDH